MVSQTDAIGSRAIRGTHNGELALLHYTPSRMYGFDEPFVVCVLFGLPGLLVSSAKKHGVHAGLKVEPPARKW